MSLLRSILAALFASFSSVEPTGAETVQALKRSGYRGTFRPWLLGDEYNRARNATIARAHTPTYQKNTRH